jgi:multidrug resistance efflux pump
MSQRFTPIFELPIVDNQAVQADDLLFRTDPSTFEADLEAAKGELERTRHAIEPAFSAWLTMSSQVPGKPDLNQTRWPN